MTRQALAPLIMDKYAMLIEWIKFIFYKKETSVLKILAWPGC